MKKICVVTDSNSGISPEVAKSIGCELIPMPFIIDGEEYFEGVNLTQDKFYEIQKSGTRITTSQPNINKIVELWTNLLKDYDEIVHIPMSSGLSQSCETALGFAEQFGGKVQVVDNKRIAISMRGSCMDALNMARDGKVQKKLKSGLRRRGLTLQFILWLTLLNTLNRAEE